MESSTSNLPLYVDLDGTLIKSDLMFESILILLKKNLFFLFAIPVWLLKGRPYLKVQLAKRVQVPIEQVPVNEEFHEFLQKEKDRGRKLVLISASNQTVVEQVSSHFDLFNECFGSNESTNLKANNKLARIQELNNGKSFSYAGNSSADLPIWKESAEVLLVNCSQSLEGKIKTTNAKSFDSAPSQFNKLLETMRPHQWLKNLLVFVPLILSHQINQLDLLFLSIIAYVSFCLCASSVYLLNDMLDLKSDRQHTTKSKRAFAAGDLPLATGFFAGPLLFLMGVLFALLLPQSFLLVLMIYWLLTSLYSFCLKRLFLMDVITLAVLYTMRVIAGSAAISVQTTVWLITFSFFLFLGLALVKRVIELLNVIGEGKQRIEGRAYLYTHIWLLSRIGKASSATAIIVFILYITAPETIQLYSSPLILWLICPLLMYLLFRIWQFAHTQKLEEDPVLFALTDRIGQVIAVVCGALIWLAA